MRTNIVQSMMLSERLDETLRKYHNRAVDSVQVIEELIALANDIRESASRARELGLSQEEIAFYEALAENGSAKKLMAHETLRTLAHSSQSRSAFAEERVSSSQRPSSTSMT
jgi:type I restriction enzyme, R subunit